MPNTKKNPPNPTGKGGFSERPDDINRDGRPKNEESPTYWLRKFLSEVDPRSNEGKKRIQQVAEKLATEAYKGNSWAMKEIFDRLDGKAPQTIKHEGEVDTGTKEVAVALRKIIETDEEE
jgi:hypothetical protein